MSRGPRGSRRLALVGALATAGAWLSWPSDVPEPPRPVGTTAFRWDADQLFTALESEFIRVGSTELRAAVQGVEILEEGNALLGRVSDSREVPFDLLERLTTLQFELAVRGATHPSLLPRVQDSSSTPV